MLACSKLFPVYICAMKAAGKAYLPLLMGLTLLIITGFQVFWLAQMYKREKENLMTRSNIEFRDAIFRLQAMKLKARFDSQGRSDSTLNITIRRDLDSSLPFEKAENVVGLANLINGNDTTQRGGKGVRMERLEMEINSSPKIIINNNGESRTVDFKGPDSQSRGGNVFFTMIRDIDAIADSIDIDTLYSAVEANFEKAGLYIPFQIVRSRDTLVHDGPLRQNVVRVGLMPHLGYELKLGNSFLYFLRKLMLPLLFSIFLLGVTIASFLLLYRNLKQQQRLAILKNDFISNITHELKTPIATVNVALEALQNFNAINDPAKTEAYIDMSRQELKRLSLLVDKVLRVSMFENSKVALKKEQVDMVALVQEVMDSMRIQFDKSGTVVNLQLQGDALMVEGDKLHLLSVVYNLLDNAMKYSKGQPVVDIYLKSGGEQLEMRVEDRGIGIPKVYHDKVFEKFFRVPTGDIHDVKGYGLGLSYVAHIVQEHGGTIALRSEEGKGCTFIIQLPVSHG